MTKGLTASYRKGFQDGFANPKRSKEEIDNFLRSGKKLEGRAEEYFNGKVDGVAEREKVKIAGNEKGFYYSGEIDEIMSELHSKNKKGAMA